MNITVLTPAYNRKYIINRLYESLKRQTFKNFEWLVVDDGSIDETEELINQYIEENVISIRYVKQKNGGKHRALNTGISMIDNEVTFIVDTDDYLLDTAIEEISSIYEKYKENSTICGYSFLRCYPDLKINGMRFAKNEYISDYISCRLNEGIQGDKAEAYLTRCLKEFPFLEINGEKFLFEDYVWIQMAEKYKTVHINKPIYVGDYLEDGLTKNISKMKYQNPVGMMERSRVMGSKKCNFINRFKAAIMYIAYGKISGKSCRELYKKSKEKWLVILCTLPGYLFKFKIEKNNSL